MPNHILKIAAIKIKKEKIIRKSKPFIKDESLLKNLIFKNPFKNPACF